MSKKLVLAKAIIEEARDLGAEGGPLLDEAAELLRTTSLEEPVETLPVCRELKTLAEKIDRKRIVAEALLGEGFCLYLVSEHDRSIPPLRRALEIFEALNDRSGIGRTKGTLAGVHVSQGDYERAFTLSFAALEITREVGDRRLEAWLLQGIGNAFGDFGDHDRAIRNHEESLKIFKEVDFPVGIGRALNGIGNVYQARGDFPEARKYHLQALDLFREHHNELGEARALNDLGVIHQKLGEYDEARRCHEEALAIRDRVGNRQAKSTSLINLGNLHIEQKNVSEAMSVLHRALTIAMEINALPRVYQANLALSEAHALAGAFEDALAHFKIYQEVKEQVIGEQVASRMRNQQIDFETEKSRREAEISRLKNVELREKNEQLEELLREIKEAETQLVQQEKMAALGKLVAGVVHEMNSPLGAITSVADTAARCVVNIVDALETAETVDQIRENRRFVRSLDALRQDSRVTREAVQRINKIVNSLKNFIRLDEASFQEVDIHEGLDSTITLLEYDFSGRIDVVRAYAELPLIRCYPSELNQVFMNLLTNAGQAIEGKGTITVATHLTGGYVRVEVADTGVGIAKAQLVNIFEPIISRKGRRMKAGMGLFTSYGIVQKHHGNIEVMSEVGVGTTFTVIIPIDEQADERSAG